MSGAAAWAALAALGACGAYARFRVTAAVTARLRSGFPFGTFAVNLTGGFALGVMTGLAVGDDALFTLGAGLLGGYTTFSTWMVESLRLGESGAQAPMWLYLAGSMLAGLAATGLGWSIGEAVA